MTGTSTQTGIARPRRLFMVLSPRSLSYARYALESLFRNVLEPVHLHLITDSVSDKSELADEIANLPHNDQHTCSVYAAEELKDAEHSLFAHYPNLRLFRQGHPCWRKITDPVLLSSSDDEMVLLDPDLYFPNRFRFETTPEEGLLLMWQKPNCLFPPEIVTSALREGIPLAHHVDIGVAHWRAPVDLDWLEWLLSKLDYANFPRVMHIEAIVWAALAMRIGGGYLSPDYWHCWHRSQPKRLLRKLGVPGEQILALDPFATIKCFHAGGEAKLWLADIKQRGRLDVGNSFSRFAPILPFVELTSRIYRREQRLKGWLRKFGYYHVFQSA